MSNQHRKLVNHTFHGRRFDDGGVDLDVLPDLGRYKTLLVEVAKELWRRNNPGRERLPKNFEDSLSVKFYEVRSNCATFPLERELSDEQQHDFSFAQEDELDDAVTLVADTIAAAANDQPLPEQFPKQLLGLFQDYGKTLRDEEWIEQRPNKRATGVRYDAVVRDRLIRRMETAYEDFVDITGEVTMARVRKPRMTLEIADGREIEASFPPADEQTIVNALQSHETARLRVIGRGQFTNDGKVQKVTEVTSVTLLPAGELPFMASAKPIWDEFADAVAGFPPDQINRLPVDGSSRHDFYIYGTKGGSE